MIDHINENAELYVLGSLDDLERARVERHVSGCVDCATRLQEAENAVANLAESLPSHAPPERLHARLQQAVRPRARSALWRSIPAAIAAALVLAFIPTWVAVDRSRHAIVAMRQDERALAMLASAPFHHAQFMSPKKRPMDAKVLYGMHGNWYYVVVMHPKPGMQVAYVHGGKMEMLGSVAMHGESGTLYLPVNHKMDELALLQGNDVVGDAHLIY
jgi:Putative zinc-finger